MWKGGAMYVHTLVWHQVTGWGGVGTREWWVRRGGEVIHGEGRGAQSNEPITVDWLQASVKCQEV